MTISRIKSQSASTATNMDTWQRNASRRIKNKKQGNVSNATKKSIWPMTGKEHSQ